MFIYSTCTYHWFNFTGYIAIDSPIQPQIIDDSNDGGIMWTKYSVKEIAMSKKQDAGAAQAASRSTTNIASGRANDSELTKSDMLAAKALFQKASLLLSGSRKLLQKKQGHNQGGKREGGLGNLLPGQNI